MLIGTTTTGKGTVNVPRRLSDGSVLYVSIARYLTPDNAPVEGVGVVPDIEIAIPDTGFEAGQDIQLFVAIDYLRGEYNPNSSSESTESEPEIVDEEESEVEGESEAGRRGVAYASPRLMLPANERKGFVMTTNADGWAGRS